MAVRIFTSPSRQTYLDFVALTSHHLAYTIRPISRCVRIADPTHRVLQEVFHSSSPTHSHQRQSLLPRHRSALRSKARSVHPHLRHPVREGPHQPLDRYHNRIHCLTPPPIPPATLAKLSRPASRFLFPVPASCWRILSVPPCKPNEASVLQGSTRCVVLGPF